MMSVTRQLEDFHKCGTCIFYMKGECVQCEAERDKVDLCHEHRYEHCKSCYTIMRPIQKSVEMVPKGSSISIELFCPSCGITRTKSIEL
ncbi:MAG: hypothetical protein ACFFCS_12170 [Candidatus Hodarchaeota archaeon]